MAAPVLFFEALIVALAIPVALVLTDTSTVLVCLGFGALAIACLVCAGLLRHPWAYRLGWVLQGLVLACGLVVPAMVVLGVVFGALWWAALHYGRIIDAASTAHNPVE